MLHPYHKRRLVSGQLAHFKMQFAILKAAVDPCSSWDFENGNTQIAEGEKNVV